MSAARASIRRGHAPGAVNLTLSDLRNVSEKLDPSRPTYVICQGGYRSSAGASILEKKGFRELYNITGGTAAWIDAGLDTRDLVGIVIGRRVVELLAPFVGQQGCRPTSGAHKRNSVPGRDSDCRPRNRSCRHHHNPPGRVVSLPEIPNGPPRNVPGAELGS